MTIAIVLIIFVLISVGFGVYFRRQSATVSDFVLGGRAVGAWITAFAYGTSYFSAVVFVGYAGQFGWKYGISALWIGIGNALIGSLLAWVLMGRRTRLMSHHLNSSTMPEFFEHRYDSKVIKIVSALVVFVFLIPYTASVYNGLSRIFETIFTIPYEYIVIGMAVVTAIYVILGGYKATAYNDFFQGIIMIVGIVAVVATALAGKGGLFSAIEELSKETGGAGPLAGINGAFTSLFGPDPGGLLGVIILTSLGTWGLPQMVHKFYTIKDESAIKAGTIVSTVFALVISGGCYFLGGFGRIFADADTAAATPPNGDFDSIIPTMMSQTLPDILLGILLVLVLSASMSTLSSLVLTSSSTLTLDLIKPMFKNSKKKLSESKMLIIMRVLIGVFLLISVVVALNKNTLISDLMGYSWGALAGAFLAPFLYGLYWKGTTKIAVMANFAFAVSITVLHIIIKPQINLFGFNLASPVNFGALTMLAGLVIVPLISLLTPKMKKVKLDDIFACFKRSADKSEGLPE
jgi:SSS family solute:Na+ symporter